MPTITIPAITTEQQERFFYMEIIKQFRRRPNKGNTDDQYTDLQSLNCQLYRRELEKLCKEWEECNDNDTNEKFRGLTKRTRDTLREAGRFALRHLCNWDANLSLFQEISFQNAREGQDQHDPVRWALHKLFKNTTINDVVPRFLVANIGGATLLVPMIIMSFATSRAAHLIVTCIFVLGFAFVFSISARATNQELLGATAAYAAVLVVYVGVASTG